MHSQVEADMKERCILHVKEWWRKPTHNKGGLVDIFTLFHIDMVLFLRLDHYSSVFCLPLCYICFCY